MIVLKDLVKDNKMSDLVMIKDGEVFYKTRDEGFEFSVPLTELKGGTYFASMKSITLMRYIRKQIDFNEKCKLNLSENKL